MNWSQARAVALRAAPPWPEAEVPLSAAHGCRLARPLRALVAVPGTDVSAMDGYAVAGEGPWRVVGRVLAGGHAHGEVLKPGYAVEIATGAPVPEGATAVLPYEAATVGDHIPGDRRADGVADGDASEEVCVGGAVDDGASEEARVGEVADGDASEEVCVGEAVDHGASEEVRVGGVAGDNAHREGRPPAGALPGGERLVRGVVEEGRHIRRRGEDVGLGEVVLAAGTTVTPAVLGLAAALGHDVLAVHRRLQVAVLVTGDEVVEAGLPGPGRVRDAIGPFLPGLVAWAGGTLGPTLRLPDGAAPLHAALRARTPEGTRPGEAGDARPPGKEDVSSAGVGGACRPGEDDVSSAGVEGACPRGEGDVPSAGAGGACLPGEGDVPSAGAEDACPPGEGDARSAGEEGVRSAEVVVVCGASSKGPADHLRGVLAELGAEVLVDGVAVRPGHPQLLARLPGGRLVVGLPGNPFAALAAALTLLVPLLRGERYEPGERVTLAETSVKDRRSGPRGLAHHRDTRLVPVRRSGAGARPVGHDRPGSLWGAALADALAVIPPGWDGEPVELLDLPA
ncbi:molybdopterin molybdotransferase MoeA [Nonomuraea sp. NPDC004354]